MQALRQLGGGIIIALVSIILVIGGISLALAESASPLENTVIPVSPTLQLVFPTFTSLSTSTQNVAFTDTVTSTLAIAPTTTQPIVCTPPSGWFQVIVGVNETIYILAQRYKTTEDAIKNANCLTSYEIQAGNILYVPPIVATAPPIVCGPPSTWIRAYIVPPGDNLFRISLLYRTTVAELQRANCMGSSIIIYTGQRLWVPNVPTSTPGVTIIPTFPTSTPSFTPVPPTYTLTSWPTASFTFVPTSSPVPPASTTPSRTQTTVPTATIFYTPSLTPFPSP